METEDWKEYKKEIQNKKSDRRTTRTDEVLKLNDAGYKVIPLTNYQFRIHKDGSNKKVDIFPTNNKYHYITENKRGVINTSYIEFVNQLFDDEG